MLHSEKLAIKDFESVEKETVEDKLQTLRNLQENHDFWNNTLFKGCKLGWFSREDFKYIFSQYYLYSKNFTRYIAFLMANCESDYFRALLSENLWEEGGGQEVEKRHAQIFRNFLTDSLGIENLNSIEFKTFTKYFVSQYLDNCNSIDSLKASAFLSLGTEGIVAKMYTVMVEGMLKAGFKDEELEFFKIHMECDDEHAETIEKMMLSYSNKTIWFESCLEAMNTALDLRKEFFENLVSELEVINLAEVKETIYKKESLLKDNLESLVSYSCLEKNQEELYSNVNERLDIDFCVKKLDFSTAQVLDPRVVIIKPKKRNENHRHAHETLVYLVKGEGEAIIDDQILPVKTGDAILFPRWSMHQVHNTSEDELVYLAVTDFEFSGRFHGIKLHDARHKKV